MLHSKAADQKGDGQHHGHGGQAGLAVEPGNDRGQPGGEQHHHRSEPHVHPEQRADLTMVDFRPLHGGHGQAQIAEPVHQPGQGHDHGNQPEVFGAQHAGKHGNGGQRQDEADALRHQGDGAPSKRAATQIILQAVGTEVLVLR